MYVLWVKNALPDSPSTSPTEAWLKVSQRALASFPTARHTAWAHSFRSGKLLWQGPGLRLQTCCNPTWRSLSTIKDLAMWSSFGDLSFCDSRQSDGVKVRLKHCLWVRIFRIYIRIAVFVVESVTTGLGLRLSLLSDFPYKLSDFPYRLYCY